MARDQGILEPRPSQDEKEKLASRIRSIDALRGFDMFWILGGTDFFLSLFSLVLPPVASFLSTQFGHSAWNGFTFYDLIFPLFMFLSGISIPFSITKRLERGDDRKALYKHIITRTVLLFTFGLISNGIYRLDFENMRWLGVLQRISIGYLIAALAAMKLRRKQQLWLIAILLLSYWGLMTLVPVPEFGAGVLTPEGNLTGFIDRLILPGMLYTPYGDNEGLLSTMPAVASTLLGVIGGHVLRSDVSQIDKTKTLLIYGGICLGLGFSWNFAFPINKFMWTSSYVLFAGGWSYLFLAVFYWIIDVKGFKRWTFFFVVIGMNSILIYLIKGLFDLDFIGDFFEPNPVLSFVLVTADIAVKWLIVYLFYRKKWFLKF